jgi:phage gpG-like protein
MIKGDLSLKHFIEGFRTFKKTAPKVCVELAEDYIKDGFDKKGNTDSGSWVSKLPIGDNELMVNTRELKNSIKISKVSFNRSAIGSSLAYSKIHNVGGLIRTTERQRRFFNYMSKYDEPNKSFWEVMASKKFIEIPKREFIGYAKPLTKMTVNRIIKMLNNISAKNSSGVVRYNKSGKAIGII